MTETALSRASTLRSLGVQLALLTIVCVLGAIAGFGTYLARDYVRAMERDVTQRTIITLHQVAGGITQHLLVRDYVAIEKQLLILDPVPGFRDIYVISPQGAVISHVMADGSGFLKAVFRQEQMAVPQSMSAHRVMHGDRLESWQPIGQERIIGWVRMISDLSVFYAEQREIYWRTAIVGLLASLLSLTLLFAFLRPRIAALNALADYARRLNTGPNEKLGIYRGSSDIETLGVTLNQAAERIAADAQSLRLQKSQLRTVVENMPVLMNALDEAGLFIVWNKECERVTGYTAAEILGNPLALEMLYPDTAYRERMLEEWQRRRSSFRDWTLTLTAKDGMHKTIAWSNLAAEFPIPGWASWSVGVDMTQVVINERLKDDFVSTVNHELRTPLAAIHGSLRLMASEVAGPLPDPARQLIAVAERNCARLTRLISNVLEIQRMQTGQVELQRSPLDPAALVAEAVESNGPYASQHNVRLTVDTATAGGATILGDADKLMQVLTNLLSNAIKFSPANCTVALAVTSSADAVTIAIRDQGPGISDAFASRLFQRFARAAEGDTQKAGGSGLGLYISKAIVTHHGGTIEFENNPGGGATFRIVLPRAPADSSAPASRRLRAN